MRRMSSFIASRSSAFTRSTRPSKEASPSEARVGVTLAGRRIETSGAWQSPSRPPGRPHGDSAIGPLSQATCPLSAAQLVNAGKPRQMRARGASESAWRVLPDVRLEPCRNHAAARSNEWRESAHSLRSEVSTVGAPVEAVAASHPLPAGMRDLLPEEAGRRRALTLRVLDHTALWGYELVTPPAFELAKACPRAWARRARSVRRAPLRRARVQ